MGLGLNIKERCGIFEEDKNPVSRITPSVLIKIHGDNCQKGQNKMSLPVFQDIVNDRGNPTFECLEKFASVFGFDQYGERKMQQFYNTDICFYLDENGEIQHYEPSVSQIKIKAEPLVM